MQQKPLANLAKYDLRRIDAPETYLHYVAPQKGLWEETQNADW
jgi:hypothetical protein